MIPKVFIYLFYFPFPLFGQWVDALKILHLDFTVGHKTLDPSVSDKIIYSLREFMENVISEDFIAQINGSTLPSH